MEETRCFTILSRDLGYVTAPDFAKAWALCDSVGQLISAPGRSLKRRREIG